MSEWVKWLNEEVISFSACELNRPLCKSSLTKS